jgi:hypothetical protein
VDAELTEQQIYFNIKEEVEEQALHNLEHLQHGEQDLQPGPLAGIMPSMEIVCLLDDLRGG